MREGTYVIDCPGHPYHQKKVEIVSGDIHYGYFIQEKDITWGILWKYLKETANGLDRI